MLGSKVAEQNDNPKGVFIPPNVLPLVRGTQIIAVLSYVFFADASLRDCVRAAENWPDFRRNKGEIFPLLAVFSCTLRFLQGILATAAALLLIMAAQALRQRAAGAVLSDHMLIFFVEKNESIKIVAVCLRT